MKTLVVLISLAALGLAADFVPPGQVASVADRLVHQKFGYEYRLAETLTYYFIDGLPNAYAFVYENGNGEPLTIVMGARYTTSPVNEITRRRPRSKLNLDRIAHAAAKRCGGPVTVTKTYYWGPGEEYVGFDNNGAEVLINAYSLQEFAGREEKLRRLVPDAGLENFTRQKWQKYFAAVNFYDGRQDGYVDSVPFIDWVYGCTPTAASMMLYYWDSRGYGKLVDYFFTHWDEPEGETNECANTNRELALAMFTDTTTGGTMVFRIVGGFNTVCNTINGYTFSNSISSQGNSSNQYQFNWIKTEIDNQRPCHWSILQYWWGGQYINHSVTGVGYDYVLPDTFVIVHNTWDSDEPLWPLWTYHNGTYSYDNVARSIPGGANANNILLDRPHGGSYMAIPSFFAGLRYHVLWHSNGSIDHVKMWWSRGQDGWSYDSTHWTLITNSAPNNGKYTWTCPATICSLRINIAGLNGSNVRQGADGSVNRTLVRNPGHSAEITLRGHYDTDGEAEDLLLNGSYAYIADSRNGLVVLNMADSTLPEYVTRLALPGNSGSIAVSGQYLYVGDKDDTLRVISIATPTNPVQVGKLAFTDDVLGIAVAGNYAYVAARGQGLVVVNVTTPSNPVVAGTYNSPGFAYDVVVDGNYAYLADATQGIRVVNVTNPANPVETGYNNTAGIAYGVAKSGNYVYAADGNPGIKVFNASNPDTLILLGSLDTPGQAQKVQYASNYLLVADGVSGGLRAVNVTNPANPTDAGYLQGYGSGSNLFLRGRMIYVADGNIGLLSVFQALYDVEEHDAGAPLRVTLEIAPLPATLDRPVRFMLGANRETTVSLGLIDCSGRRVASIYEGGLKKGANQICWQPAGIAAGIYFVEQTAADGKAVRKLVLLR